VQLTIRIKPEKVSVRLNFFNNSKIIDRNLRNSVDFEVTLLYFGITKIKRRRRHPPKTLTPEPTSANPQYGTLPCQKLSGYSLTPKPEALNTVLNLEKISQQP
jgi:hypothetical protein